MYMTIAMTMYIYMTMCIIMNMNIYITKQNEERLRTLNGKTMSGLINGLLESYWGERADEKTPSGSWTVRKPEEPKQEQGDEEETDSLKDFVYEATTNAVYDRTTGEQTEATPKLVKELKRCGQVV